MNEAQNWDPADSRGAPDASVHQDEHPIAAMMLATVHVIWKWKWVVLPVVVMSMIIGLVMAMLTTPMYRATAQIRIDRETAKVVDVQGGDAVSTTSDRGAEFYQTQYGILRSRPVASKTVELLNLDQDPTFMGGPAPSGAGLEERNNRRQAATDRVMGGREISPVSLSGLVNISFVSQDPGVAAKVANALGEAFIEANRESRLKRSEYARDFLAKETLTALTRLNDSERAAVDYARTAEIITLNAGGGQEEGAATASLVAANLGALNNAVNTARTTRLLAEQRWRQVANANPADLPEVQSSTMLQNLRQTLSELEASYLRDRTQFGPAWQGMVEKQVEIEELKRQINAEMLAVKNSIRTGFETAQAQEAALTADFNRQKVVYRDMEEKNIRYLTLLRNADSDRTNYQALLDRYNALSVAANVDNTNVSFVEDARPPGAPFKPQPLRNLLLAGFFGLVIGALLALGLEQLDETIKAPGDVESKLGIPLLGAIPVVARDTTPTQAMADARSPLSEAYYSVRTALQFSTREGAPRTLLVTSARPSEGKSTSAVALAQGFARLGSRTVLIDSDLRNPSLHKLMGAQNSVGLSNLLTGQIDVAKAALPTAFENLSFIACGPLPPNPAELLGGPQMRQLLAELSEHFDQVIIDGPPVMGLADAPLLASIAAGTVLVVEAGSTRRSMARTALTRLRVGPVRVVGAVLSKFQPKRAFGHGYGYGAGYGYGYEYGGTTAAPAKNRGLGGVFKRKKP